MESLIVFILNTPNVKFLSLKMFIYSQPFESALNTS